MISIEGLDKAAVLKALYDAAQLRDLEFLHARGAPLTIKDCRRIVNAGQLDLDYLYGRVMKIDLSDNLINPWLYDRDNGTGAAERAIDRIRSVTARVEDPAA